MRRRRQNTIPVELFPFLSVLACVIGVLTLMIVAIALGQMDADVVEKIERGERYERTQETIEQHAQRENELRQLVARAEAVASELDRARDELERLESERDRGLEPEAYEQRNITLLAEADELSREVERLERNLETIQERIEELRTKLDERQKPPDARRLVVEPGGTGRIDAQAARQIVFIECRAENLLVYEQFTGDQAARFPRTGLSENLAFIDLLDHYALNDQRVIFLVREDGADTAMRAESLASDRGVYNGKLPLIGQGEIDLGLFERLVE